MALKFYSKGQHWDWMGFHKVANPATDLWPLNSDPQWDRCLLNEKQHVSRIKQVLCLWENGKLDRLEFEYIADKQRMKEADVQTLKYTIHMIS